MFKTLNNDRATIERKYHNPEEYEADKRLGVVNRMLYHGYDYDEATGLGDEEIDKGLNELSKQLEGLPHPIHKAKLFEYVLENTRIDVNEHDYFIGMYTWNRPISKYTVNKWSGEVYEMFPGATASMAMLEESGAAYGGLDFDHTVPDWDSLMELGFPGILKRAEKTYDKLEKSGMLTQKQEDFYKGLELEYKAIIRFIDRIYKYALTKNFEKAPKIARCLKNLRDGAPSDSYEALQLIYIYFMLSESVDHYQVRSLGYGFDATLMPFYQKDIESGRYTVEEIAEFIGYFLMQWSAIDNYWGQPLYLAGTTVDGTTKVNKVSYMLLDVYDKLKLYNPKIQIKISKSTPKDFLCKALDMIRRGISSIVFVCEDHITKTLMANGATYEKAVDSVIRGCYEYTVKADGIGIANAYFNALKPVSWVFDNGFDRFSNEQLGIKTGNIESFSSFEEFYEAYMKQLEYMITAYMDALYQLESKVQEINPSLMFSGTMLKCTENLTDALDSGIKNDTKTLLCGLGTAVDALMAVYELVFEKQVTTLSEMKKALENDWNGYEKLRAMALNAAHKYGNNDKMSDFYAAAIARNAADLIHGRRNPHGGRCSMEIHSARAFIIHGEKTMATPDGRKAGDEMSKNASPTPGADRKGITALINSATAIDTSLADGGFCLDAMLHPTAVQGEDGLEAFYSVLTTYMSKGGASIHFNIFDADLLKDAQKNPQKYKNLQVRVCGWNVLWNTMNKKEQDAYILRAEKIAR